MKFEFDQAKSKANKEKHGVGFEEAQAIWQEAYVEIAARGSDELRWIALGRIGDRIYACVYTYRDESIRLISCRRARDKEANIYHGYLKENIRES